MSCKACCLATLFLSGEIRQQKAEEQKERYLSERLPREAPAFFLLSQGRHRRVPGHEKRLKAKTVKRISQKYQHQGKALDAQNQHQYLHLSLCLMIPDRGGLSELPGKSLPQAARIWSGLAIEADMRCGLPWMQAACMSALAPSRADQYRSFRKVLASAPLHCSSCLSNRCVAGETMDTVMFRCDRGGAIQWVPSRTRTANVGWA